MNDEEKMPLLNKAVYQIVVRETNGNVAEFAKMIGMSQQRISRLFSVDKRNGKYPKVSQSVVDAVCDTFNTTESKITFDAIGVNEEEIDPLKDFVADGARTEVQRSEAKISSIQSGNGKPFYNVPFVMGYELPFNDNESHPDYLIDFAPYNKCDFWCKATGESMHPTISNGDVIAVKMLEDFRYLVNNEIYAIVLKSGLRTIKRTWDNGESYTLIADNKECPSQEIPKSEILCVFRVLGAMKMF